jgi:hypothetical protein
LTARGAHKFYGFENHACHHGKCFHRTPSDVFLGMKLKIPAKLRETMREIAREFGRQGGKKAARNSTPEERSARAKKASVAAAKKRTEKRLAAQRKNKPAKKSLKRK